LNGDREVVAILPWGDVIDDFLDAAGVTLDAFCDEMDGGWLFGFVTALDRAGITTTIVCPSRAVTTPRRRVHAPTGAPIWLLPEPRAHRAAARLARAIRRRGRDASFAELVAQWTATPMRALLRALRAEGVGLLLCQEYDYGRFEVASAAGFLSRIPVAATFQGGFPGPPLVQSIRRRSVAHSAGLVISDRSEAERVERDYRVPRARIARVPNPVDTTRWSPADAATRAAARQRLGVPAGAFLAAWHGRVDLHRKGLDVLAVAWRRLVSQCPARDLRLSLVGTGPDAPELQALLHGVPQVDWYDEYVTDRSEIALRLAAADVFVFPSRHEGFAVAPLEAMASGVPVVAAAAAGVVELLSHGAAGIVVAPGDADALAAAVGALVDDPARRALLGAAARSRVEDGYSLDAVGGALARALRAWGLGAPARRSG
jgi:starch synthase